jgi:hypothetical protein
VCEGRGEEKSTPRVHPCKNRKDGPPVRGVVGRFTRKVKFGWYVRMLRSERRSQPQDPGSKSEPGAPSAYFGL